MMYGYHIYDYGNPNGTEVLVTKDDLAMRLVQGFSAESLAKQIRELDQRDDFEGIQTLLKKY